MQRRNLHPLLALLFLLAASPAPATVHPQAAGDITIAAVGDIMLGHRAEPYLTKERPGYPFVNVLPGAGEVRRPPGTIPRAAGNGRGRR